MTPLLGLTALSTFTALKTTLVTLKIDQIFPEITARSLYFDVPHNKIKKCHDCLLSRDFAFGLYRRPLRVLKTKSDSLVGPGLGL